MIKQTLPTVDELTRLIEDATSGGCHPSVIQRLSILRYFVLYRPTVLELCRHFGISRSTFPVSYTHLTLPTKRIV